jgi:hypothetical protein
VMVEKTGQIYNSSPVTPPKQDPAKTHYKASVMRLKKIHKQQQ